MNTYWDKSCWFVLAIVFLVTVGTAVAALQLRWRDNSTIEDGYLVLRQRQPMEKGFTPVKQLPANSTTWTDPTPNVNQKYCYIVVAFKADERSFSNVACGSAKNQIRTSVGGNANIINLSWDGPSGQLTANVGQ